MWTTGKYFYLRWTMSKPISRNKAKSILEQPYARRLTPEAGGGYLATIQEFPGCFAEGQTADEALQKLDEVAESWINVSLANGREIQAPFSFDGFSGKVALRIPRGLHQQVAELAELEECSINQILTAAISEYVGRNQALRKFQEIVHSAVAGMSEIQPVDRSAVDAEKVHPSKPKRTAVKKTVDRPITAAN